MDIADLSALLGEEVSASTNADVWVVLPARAGGSPAAADLALVGEARHLADGLGCYVHALVPEESAAELVIAVGADRAHVTADAAAYLIEQQPEFVLLSQAQNSLAGALAQRLGAGLITDVPGGLEIEPESRALLAPHPVYGGEYFVDLAVTSPVKMATLDTRELIAPSADPNRTGEIVTGDQPPAAPRWRDLGPTSYQQPHWRPLSKARVIVAAGRGVHDAEGFSMVAALAQVLGAELAGDRSARDSDWVDEAHEVGVTAQEVAPELYVAVGILGDTVHNAAISGARKVIAIHPNANAPIFDLADLGLVAEPKEFLPTLIAALR